MTMRTTLHIALLLALAVAGCKSPKNSAAVSSARPASTGTSTGVAGNGPVRWGAPVEVASGEAYRGRWRMNESTFNYVDDPTVAVSSDGAFVVVWVDNARKDVFLRTFGPDGEPRSGSPTAVSRNPATFSWLPRVATSPDGGEVFVLWQEIIFSGGSHGGEILFARSVDGGATFSEPLNLSNTPAGCGKGRLSTDDWSNGSLDLLRMPTGTLVAAWTEYEGPLRVSTSRDGGASFTPPVHLAGSNALPARGPALAASSSGELHVAWAVGESKRGNIHLATSADGGLTFGEPVVVTDTPNFSDSPDLVVAPDGRLHIVFGESDGGPPATSHVRYVQQRRDGTLSTSRKLSGDTAAGFPSLAVDPAGRLVAVWERYPDGERPLGLQYTVSEDHGTTFATPALVPYTANDANGANGSLQGKLMRKVAARAGRIGVVNSTFVPGKFSVVHLVPGRMADER